MRHKTLDSQIITEYNKLSGDEKYSDRVIEAIKEISLGLSQIVYDMNYTITLPRKIFLDTNNPRGRYFSLGKNRVLKISYNEPTLIELAKNNSDYTTIRIILTEKIVEKIILEKDNGKSGYKKNHPSKEEIIRRLYDYYNSDNPKSNYIPSRHVKTILRHAGLITKKDNATIEKKIRQILKGYTPLWNVIAKQETATTEKSVYNYKYLKEKGIIAKISGKENIPEYIKIIGEGENRYLLIKNTHIEEFLEYISTKRKQKKHTEKEIATPVYMLYTNSKITSGPHNSERARNNHEEDTYIIPLENRLIIKATDGEEDHNIITTQKQAHVDFIPKKIINFTTKDFKYLEEVKDVVERLKYGQLIKNGDNIKFSIDDIVMEQYGNSTDFSNTRNIMGNLLLKIFIDYFSSHRLDEKNNRKLNLNTKIGAEEIINIINSGKNNNYSDLVQNNKHSAATLVPPKKISRDVSADGIVMNHNWYKLKYTDHFIQELCKHNIINGRVLGALNIGDMNKIHHILSQDYVPLIEIVAENLPKNNINKISSEESRIRKILFNNYIGLDCIKYVCAKDTGYPVVHRSGISKIKKIITENPNKKLDNKQPIIPGNKNGIEIIINQTDIIPEKSTILSEEDINALDELDQLT